jgi:hypothetical protein
MTHSTNQPTHAKHPHRADPPKRLAKFSFLWLLIALVVTLLLAPLMQDRLVGNLLMHGCFTLVFLTGLLANRERPWIFRTALVLAVIGIPLGWTRLFSGNIDLNLTRLVVDILFFAFTAIIILIAVIKDHTASWRSILGAISVYLLMGLSWTLAYSALEIIEHEPFRFVERQTTPAENGEAVYTVWPQMVYYSFVTMSTLGFGDITPRTPLAQTLTWMQAVFGQLFLVVLVARLVSLLPQTNADRQDSS